MMAATSSADTPILVLAWRRRCAVLDESTPVYMEVPGWQENITGVRDFDGLPRTAQNYVLEIEKQIGCWIRYVSVGPERESLIDRGEA